MRRRITRFIETLVDNLAGGEATRVVKMIIGQVALAYSDVPLSFHNPFIIILNLLLTPREVLL